MFNIHYKNINDFKSLDIALHYATCRYALPNVELESLTKGNKIVTDQMSTYEVSYTDSTYGLAWKRIDDRFDTLFGSTYEVPTGDFQTHEEAYRIWIYGDSHLQYTGNTFGVCGYPAPEDIKIENYKNSDDEIDLNYYDDSYRNTQKSYQVNEHARIYTKSSGSLLTLSDIIRLSYPNATIVEYGDFISPKFTYSDPADYPINKLYDDLINIAISASVDLDNPNFTTESLLAFRELLPTHIVVNSIERCYELEEDVFDSLKYIVNFCKNFGIRLVVVTDPFYQNISNYDDVVDTFEKSVYSEYLFDLTDWMSSRDRDYSYIFGDLPNDASYYDIQNTFYNYLPDFAYNAIIRYVFDKWELPIHRDHYYVSLVYQHIDSNTYSSYFINTFKGIHHNMGAECFCAEAKLSIPQRENVIIWSADPKITQHHVGKYGSDHAPNLFMNTGQFIAVVLHTDYSDTLLAHQQFQANTNYEYLCQTDTCGENYTGRNLINTLPVRCYLTGAVVAERHGAHFPVYPCTGAPWFVMSDKNVADYRFSWNTGDNVALIDFWLTFSDAMNCSLTIKVRGHHEELDNWQSISFGRFPYKQTENYSYSLYCAGGSLGISNDIYVFTPISGGPKRHYEGNSYDLDFHNVSWGHPATLLYPNKFNGANTSNFRVLSIEGIWKNIYAMQQDTEIVPWPTAGPPPDYATILGGLFGVMADNDHSLFPTGIGHLHVDSTIYVNTHGYNNITGRNYLDDSHNIFNTHFIPVYIFLSSTRDHFESLQCVTIPDVFCTFDREIYSGEYEAQDGSKYLIIPSGWDGRLYAYDYYSSPFGHRFKVLNEPWEACDVVELYERYTMTRHVDADNFTRCRLAIRIG